LINDSIAKGIDPKTLPIGAETNGAGLSKGARRVSPNLQSTLHISLRFGILNSTPQ